MSTKRINPNYSIKEDLLTFVNKQEANTISLFKAYLPEWRKEGRRVFATSSFQTQSVPLLHLIGLNFPEITVLFLDTGYLFPETYVFKKQLEKEFHLNVKTLKSDSSLIQQKDDNTGLMLYATNPDRCCYMNKVKPLDGFLQEGDVWISGVRRDQTSVRKVMKVKETSSNNVIKYHPMLEWTKRDIYHYIQNHQLPKHPLEEDGYVSIGCVPCTHKWADGSDRGGRWVGSKKTECGLHTQK